MTTAPLVFHPLAELVDQIGGLCAQKKSGNLVLISDDNRMAQMHLLQGLFVFIMCRGRRGRDALPLLRTMSYARMTLDSSMEVRGDGTAFAPASVLAYLKGTTEQLPELTTVGGAAQAGAAPAASAAAAPAARAPQAAPQAQPAARPSVSGITADTRYLLQNCMVRYIGPMAEIVCEEHFDAIKDLASLVTALAAEIPNKDQRSAFKADVAKALGIAVA